MCKIISIVYFINFRWNNTLNEFKIIFNKDKTVSSLPIFNTYISVSHSIQSMSQYNYTCKETLLNVLL